MSDGEIADAANRSWATKADDSPVRCYLGMKGRITLAELLAHFAEKYPHVDPMTLELNYSTVVWEEPPTADDLAQREEHRAWHAERQARWERDTYERLKAKFAG